MDEADKKNVRGACIPVPDQPGVFLSFPTICFQMQHPGLEPLNQELRELILADEASQPGWRLGVSIRGGYHSDTKFLDRPEAAVKRLKELLVQDISEYTRAYWGYESTVELERVKRVDDFQIRLWGWSVVLRAGDYSELHAHPHCNLSGVYYVWNSAPEDPEMQGAGNLVLCDPRGAAQSGAVMGQVSTLKIPASPGGLVMFPSYMQHYVLPFRGSGERISVAFNVRFVGAATDLGTIG